MNHFDAANCRRAIFSCFSMAIAFALGVQEPRAATNNATGVPDNRWLMVVQTTASMQPRAVEAANLAAMLVASGMSGQMAAGDTLGLWTFDDSLHSGVFPLQLWTPSTRKAIADHIYDFLRAQKFQKEGHLSFVLFDARKVIENSEFLTIVLITDGTENLQGTPFDEKINKIYATWRKDQEKAHIPFITVLRAEHGKLTNCAVTVAPCMRSTR